MMIEFYTLIFLLLLLFRHRRATEHVHVAYRIITIDL